MWSVDKYVVPADAIERLYAKVFRVDFTQPGYVFAILLPHQERLCQTDGSRAVWNTAVTTTRSDRTR